MTEIETTRTFGGARRRGAGGDRSRLPARPLLIEVTAQLSRWRWRDREDRTAPVWEEKARLMRRPARGAGESPNLRKRRGPTARDEREAGLTCSTQAKGAIGDSQSSRPGEGQGLSQCGSARQIAGVGDEQAHHRIRICPGYFIVAIIFQETLACHCGQYIATAPPPPRALDKSLYGPASSRTSSR